MAVFIRNENYINFNVFWPDEVDNVSKFICHIMIVIIFVEGVHS